MRLAVIFLFLAALAGGCARTASSTARTASAGPGSATVAKEVDGDTIRVDLGGREERVRFIGIDTPETHGPGGLRECFGAEAAKRTAALLPVGSQVRLVRDVEPRDKYGRLLAYVYRPDGMFVNLALARDGYAASLTIPPNIAHRDEFLAAVASARDRNLGLWGACGGPDTPLRRIPPVPSSPP